MPYKIYTPVLLTNLSVTHDESNDDDDSISRPFDQGCPMLATLVRAILAIFKAQLFY